ncbi:MAG: TRAP transporter small permease subunit [Acidiferrobacterales bacterium]|nr:TRAP transporter small permease subunit [Acidiferrobacterales bacterium]
MLKTLEHGINRVTDCLGYLAATLLILLVVVMAYNVIGRYAFSASSLGLEELSWHFYTAIFLLGIPFALKTGSHVRVDLLYDRFSRKTQALIDLIGSVFFLIPTCLVVIWSGWEFTASSYNLGAQPDSISSFFQQLFNTGIGEKSQDPGGLLNRWIIKGVIPVSFFFLLLSSVAFFIQRLNVFLGIEQAHDEDHNINKVI